MYLIFYKILYFFKKLQNIKKKKPLRLKTPENCSFFTPILIIYMKQRLFIEHLVAAFNTLWLNSEFFKYEI